MRKYIYNDTALAWKLFIMCVALSKEALKIINVKKKTVLTSSSNK